MTSLSVTCPFCEYSFQAPRALQGTDVKCPRCGQEFPFRVSTPPESPTKPRPAKAFSGESKETEGRFAGAVMAASDDFYFTDIVALSTQGLMVVATMISLPAAVYFFLGAMVGAEQIASAITAAAFAASCAWMFAVAGAVRAVIYIARRSESGFQK